MTRLEFRNRLCILRSIDRHELVEAGAIDADDFTTWSAFVSDPEWFFVFCEDHRAEKIWRVIERRTLPAETNWLITAEAAKAIAAGIVPEGCSIDDTGALVIPDHVATSGVLAHFDRVVTTTGRIVKDRDGALKAARAQ